MGRKLMMVPDNWSHPVELKETSIYGLNYTLMLLRFKPLYDRDYEDDLEVYEADLAKWNSGFRKPPQPEDYRPWTRKQAKKFTWCQVWETVSEGTPVTPAFATKEELVSFLVCNGDYWDVKRRHERQFRASVWDEASCAPWTKEAAMDFVFGGGWAPSAAGRRVASVDGESSADGKRV